MVSRTRIVSLMLTVSLVASAGQAQSPLPGAPPQGPPVFTPEQLEQLLAPIALHPDPLVGQILMAATYPLEVVEASRWLQDPNHAALTGPALAAALDLRPWDPSVKALVPFPEILRMMDASLEWTEAVGDAFLSDQAAVMDAIQRLRQRAQSAGTLVTTTQQMVVTADQTIGIIPADPQVVYVPMYDPGTVYGTWVYAPSPFYGYPSLVGAPLGGLGFGVGIVVVSSYWGWHHWDWHHHRLHVDNDWITRFGHRPPPGGIWQHDPDHRHGIPYRDPGARARFGAPYGDVRGYSPGPLVRPGIAPPPRSPAPPRVAPAPAGPAGAPWRDRALVRVAPSRRRGLLSRRRVPPHAARFLQLAGPSARSLPPSSPSGGASTYAHRPSAASRAGSSSLRPRCGPRPRGHQAARAP